MNGSPAPVDAAEVAFVRTFVPGGHAVVEMRYRRRAADLVFGIVSLASLAGALVFLVASRGSRWDGRANHRLLEEA